MKKRPHLAGMVILCLLLVVSLSPILLVLINSLKIHEEILRNPMSLPTVLHFENYAKTWKAAGFSTAFLNSLKVTGTAIVIACFAAACIGYVLAGKKIASWKLMSLYFMLATTIPLQLFMLPLYSTFVKLNLLGNPYAVGVAIAAWNIPLPVFLMRTYYLKVPAELEEAARVDGAGTLQVFTKVMLPIVSPGMITAAIVVGLSAWNEYLLTSTLLQGEENFTATLRYVNLNNAFSVDYSVLMAGAAILVLPMIVLFLLLQKKFIEGMASGAVKG